MGHQNGVPLKAVSQAGFRRRNLPALRPLYIGQRLEPRRENGPGLFALSAGYRGTAGVPGLRDTDGDRASRSQGK